jgi:uncharacterized protein (DUF736 family)
MFFDPARRSWPGIFPKESFMNFNFNLFTVKSDAKVIPQFTKEVPADYEGTSQNEGISKILGAKAIAKSGEKYIRVRVTIEDKTHFGALFRNTKKESDKQPDFTGSLDLDDKGEKRLRLAAWVKTGEKAGKFLSVAASEPLAKAEATPAPAAAVEEDEIDF